MSHFGNTCQCEWPYDLNGEKKKREIKRYTLTISIDYKRSCIFNILCKDYYWTLLKNDRAEKNVFQNGKILLTSASQN